MFGTYTNLLVKVLEAGRVQHVFGEFSFPVQTHQKQNGIELAVTAPRPTIRVSLVCEVFFLPKGPQKVSP